MLDLAEKQRLTHDALRDFTNALPSHRYDVRIIPRKRGNRPATRNWTRAVLLAPDTIKFLRAANADDSDIFIRPGLANYVLVDFDADGDARLKALLDDGVPVALAVRTSPDHVQAWIDIGTMREVTADEGAEAARILARRYGGDMGATGRMQLGRAPGFFNRKPKYRDENNHFPLVRIIHSRPGRRATAILTEARSALARAPAGAAGVPVARAQRPSLDDGSDGDIILLDRGKVVGKFSAPPKLGAGKEAFDNALRHMLADGYPLPRRADGDVDRSRRDIDVAAFMLCCDLPPDDVEAAIMEGSDKATERTTENARSYARNRTAMALRRLGGSVDS
ncbi:DNA-primase RepB domain-containing protein [Oleisolibacter albus]|uniref:DNA-primase RepB domain-containing protein n=1 Tax=Oleisolibacter albus TaxID=2171757 RepID=UPI000DF12269|nr:DNA-primase RepB domain-containing protein [Oleisolibacter albus]